MIEKIKEAAERIRNSDAVKKALAQAQEMADQAEKQLEEGIEQLKQIDVEELAKDSKEALEKGVEQIKEKADEIANSEEVQAAIAKGKEVGKAIQEGDVEELKRHAKEGAEVAQQKGQEAAQYAQEKGQQLKEEVEKIDVEELKKQGKEAVDKGVEKG